ncbi:PRC-barrel domain-containing protein [Streptomyces sp. INA 01156]
MNELPAVRCLRTLPVVTLGGDAVAHVKDTVLDATAGRVTGFTLTGRTLLSGPLPRELPWPAVHSLGRHAVMVRDEGALCGVPLSVARRDALHGRLLSAQVLTDEGDAVGTVLDVLVEGGTSGRIVAFRLAAHRESAPGSRHHRHRVYVPRGEAVSVSVSGRSLVVPAHATHVTDGLPDFVARVGASRARRTGALP